jgi:hypothetical protein
MTIFTRLCLTFGQKSKLEENGALLSDLLDTATLEI